jgi:hypothetical protein
MIRRVSLDYLLVMWINIGKLMTKKVSKITASEVSGEMHRVVVVSYIW